MLRYASANCSQKERTCSVCFTEQKYKFQHRICKICSNFYKSFPLLKYLFCKTKNIELHPSHSLVRGFFYGVKRVPRYGLRCIYSW